MPNLVYVKGRVIVKIDTEYKNSVTFSNGVKIKLERRYDNFNCRYTQPVNAIVVSGEGIPEGAEILVHHNASHPTSQIFNFKQSSDIGDIRYFSIPINECFAWYDKENKKWMPFEGFDFALRIFKPYTGVLQVEPELVKNVLWMTTGQYANTAMQTIKHTDYEMIFQDVNGREGRLIRVRTKENKHDQREEETVFEQKDITKKILKGELLVGLTKTDAKPLKEIQYA